MRSAHLCLTWHDAAGAWFNWWKAVMWAQTWANLRHTWGIACSSSDVTLAPASVDRGSSLRIDVRPLPDDSDPDLDQTHGMESRIICISHSSFQPRNVCFNSEIQKCHLYTENVSSGMSADSKSVSRIVEMFQLTAVDCTTCLRMPMHCRYTYCVWMWSCFTHVYGGLCRRMIWWSCDDHHIAVIVVHDLQCSIHAGGDVFNFWVIKAQAMMF